MNPAATTRWCKKKNCCWESSVVVNIPGNIWKEKQIQQAVMALVPAQQMYILDMRADQATSCSYVFPEWRREIPTCFQGASLHLTNDIKAHQV